MQRLQAVMAEDQCQLPAGAGGGLLRGAAGEGVQHRLPHGARLRAQRRGKGGVRCGEREHPLPDIRLQSRAVSSLGQKAFGNVLCSGEQLSPALQLGQASGDRTLRPSAGISCAVDVNRAGLVGQVWL